MSRTHMRHAEPEPCFKPVERHCNCDFNKQCRLLHVASELNLSTVRRQQAALTFSHQLTCLWTRGVAHVQISQLAFVVSRPVLLRSTAA